MSPLLLDTHVFLWAVADPSELHEAVREHLLDRARPVLVSAVCVWEAAIKQSIGRLEVAGDVDLAGDIRRSGFTELPITARHGQATADLPAIHRDPFDRLLVAQALEEDLTLVTADDTIWDYPGVGLLDAATAAAR